MPQAIGTLHPGAGGATLSKGMSHSRGGGLTPLALGVTLSRGGSDPPST